MECGSEAAAFPAAGRGKAGTALRNPKVAALAQAAVLAAVDSHSGRAEACPAQFQEQTRSPAEAPTSVRRLPNPSRLATRHLNPFAPQLETRQPTALPTGISPARARSLAPRLAAQPGTELRTRQSYRQINRHSNRQFNPQLNLQLAPPLILHLIRPLNRHVICRVNRQVTPHFIPRLNRHFSRQLSPVLNHQFTP